MRATIAGTAEWELLISTVWPSGAACATYSAPIMLPAPAQGALAVECRSDDAELVRILAELDDKSTRAAIDAARDTGSQRLDELGLNREKGEATIRNLLEGLTDAARASANAAADTVRNKG